MSVSSRTQESLWHILGISVQQAAQWNEIEVFCWSLHSLTLDSPSTQMWKDVSNVCCRWNCFIYSGNPPEIPVIVCANFCRSEWGICQLACWNVAIPIWDKHWNWSTMASEGRVIWCRWCETAWLLLLGTKSFTPRTGLSRVTSMGLT